MARLNEQTLAALASDVRRPRYDRSRLGIGMAHLGVGAFHRCHQAEYTDDMLEQQFGDWGVVGINLRPPALGATLGAQDGLYARTLREGDDSDLRVIGCIRQVIDAGDAVDTALDALAAPNIAVVTMTVTEKGYCHVPATGGLDETHPDIVHDLAAPHAPRSIPGLLTEMLDRRRATHGAGVTLISCDNIPSNGAILEQVVLSFAGERDPALADWISTHVRFPSTMVDRIVPATQAQDVQRASAACGLEDRATVVGEPFRQWVLEDSFHGRRPAWDLAGAAFVADVQPYELVKMRLLNAAQSAWSYLGALTGLEYTCDAAHDPVLGPLVERMLRTESAATVPVVPTMEPAPYIDSVLRRVRNRAISHTNHQVATDGSQKIVQRLLNPIRDQLARGQSTTMLSLGVAGWMAYGVAGAARFGRRWAVQDPLAPALSAIADRNGDNRAMARDIIGIEAVFGTDLVRDSFCEQVSRHLDGLLSANPRQYLAQLLSSR